MGDERAFVWGVVVSRYEHIHRKVPVRASRVAVPPVHADVSRLEWELLAVISAMVMAARDETVSKVRAIVDLDFSHYGSVDVVRRAGGWSSRLEVHGDYDLLAPLALGRHGVDCTAGVATRDDVPGSLTMRWASETVTRFATAVVEGWQPETLTDFVFEVELFTGDSRLWVDLGSWRVR